MDWNPARWFAPKAMAEETYTLSDDSVLRAFFGALDLMTSSGVRITQESALRSVAVLACLIVRCETFSSLPLDVLRRAGRYRLNEEQHPAYRLLTIAPNELINAGEFWRWKQLTEDIRGNAYARIVWRRGEAYEVWPLTGTPPRLFLDRPSGRMALEYKGDEFTPADVYPLRDVLHFKSAVLRRPHEGASLVDLASEAIGVSVGSEQFFARLLGNGAHFPGYLETDTSLRDEDFKALEEQFKGRSGLVQAGSVRIFDRGLKYRQNPMSIKDAQLTEMERLQLQKICSIFRVPMASVQDLTNGTYSNTEQQDLALGKHCITPICVSTERVVRHRLFATQPEYTIKFNLDGLLRGDYKTRTEGDATLVRAGVITRNEARGHQDLNPLKGLDIPRSELNLGNVASDGTVTGPSDPDQPEGDGSSAPPAPPVEQLLRPLIEDAAVRIAERRKSDRERGRTRRDTEAFASRKMAPIREAYKAAGVEFDDRAFIRKWMDAAGVEDEPDADSRTDRQKPAAKAPDAPPRRTQRETKFITDERGAIVGKIETETELPQEG